MTHLKIEFGTDFNGQITMQKVCNLRQNTRVSKDEYLCCAIMASANAATLPEVEFHTTTEVPAGNMAILNCTSKDKAHNFQFWNLANNAHIGPGNIFDEGKYNYEVLSGRLFIKKIEQNESGLYKCVSKSVAGNQLNVGAVEVLVKDGLHHAQGTSFQAFELVCIIISTLVIIGCIVAYFKLRERWSKYDGRGGYPVDEDDEDGEEIYNRTTTPLQISMPGPSRNASSDHLFGIDNRAVETDFNAVFEQIQIKMPDNRSLI